MGRRKKTAKKKTQPIGKIRNRLFGLWSDAVLARNDWTCEYCGAKRGDPTKKGNRMKIDAHHLFSRDVKNAALKFDIRNGVAVCPTCHKWGPNSFHRNAPMTMKWLQETFPERYDFVLEHWEFRVDLDNRKILEAIEEKLRNKEPLDLEELSRIEKQFPRPSRKKKIEFEGSLFDALQESSSSSED